MEGFAYGPEVVHLSVGEEPVTFGEGAVTAFSGHPSDGEYGDIAFLGGLNGHG